MNIQINKKNIFSRFAQSSTGRSSGGATNIDLSGFVEKWETWDAPLDVNGKLSILNNYAEGQNFVFTGVDPNTGGGSGSGSSVTSISFTGRTLTLSQNNVSDLTATFSLVAADIPNLAASKITSGVFGEARIPNLGISKITNLQTALDGKISLSEKGSVNGVAELDANGKVPLNQINDAILGQVEYKGTWNAATNTPTLPSTPTQKGDYYVVTDAGTFAGIDFEVGDWIISNGTIWQKVDNTDAVSSVFGRTGNITAQASDYAGFYVDLTTAQTVGGLKTFSDFVTSENFVFTGVSGGSGGGGTGSSVTAISFTGRTLTLSQNNVSDLTATFSLVANDIPNLDASKITSGVFNIARIPDIGIAKVTNLQAALDGKENAFSKGNIVAGTGISGTGTLTGRLVNTGNVTIALEGQALALHNLSTNGLIARTGAGTVAGRTITGSTSISITNGNGVSGNPTISAIFGTTAGTVAQGNDSRIINGQTAFGWGDFRDFGLGTSTPTDNQANQDDFGNPTRFFRRDSSPSVFPSNGAGIHLRYNSQRGVQIFGSITSAERLWWRSSTANDVWSPLREIWHDGNLRSDSQNDARYVEVAGDTMTGQLVLSYGGSPSKLVVERTDNTINASIRFSTTTANVDVGQGDNGWFAIGAASADLRFSQSGTFRVQASNGNFESKGQFLGAVGRINMSVTNLVLDQTSTGRIDLRINDVNALQIANNRNVGIATGTPEERLDVNGQALVGGNTAWTGLEVRRRGTGTTTGITLSNNNGIHGRIASQSGTGVAIFTDSSTGIGNEAALFTNTKNLTVRGTTITTTAPTSTITGVFRAANTATIVSHNGASGSSRRILLRPRGNSTSAAEVIIDQNGVVSASNFVFG